MLSCMPSHAWLYPACLLMMMVLLVMVLLLVLPG